MKRTVCILAMIALASFGSEYETLYNEIQVMTKAFKDSPTESLFLEAKAVAEQMIQLDELDGRGYVYLSRLNEYAAGTIMDEVEAREAAFSIIDQYQKIQGRKFDLSEVHTRLSSLVEISRETTENKKTTKRMQNYAHIPTAIKEVDALIDQYEQKLRNGVQEPSILDQAIVILERELDISPDEYKVYLAFYRVHKAANNYIEAYAYWYLACHFGDAADPALINASVDLYQTAMNYEVNHEVGNQHPGPDPVRYFLWLHREYLGSKVPAEIKHAIDDAKASQEIIRKEALK